MRSFRRLTFIALALAMPTALFVACSDSTTDDDGGTEDSSTGRDARADTSVRDATSDTSRPDTSTPDSSRPDTSVPDASDGGRDASDGGDGSVVADGGDGGDGGDADASDGAAIPGAKFMVVRIGDGVAALSNASTAMFLEERSSGDGAVVRTIALPTAVNGANQPIALAGTSPLEGSLTLSGNGTYVSVAGYAAAPGVVSIASTTSAATSRVVARVDKNAVIDTTTRFDAAFSGDSIRSAATDDGNAYWAVGAVGGVNYVPFGTTGGTQIMAAPANLRAISVFGGQLYASTASGAGGNNARVFTVGANLPVTAGQTANALPGIANTNTPAGFVLLDLDAAVAGVDTAYVADGRTLASAGGVQKWTYNGVTWTLAATFKTGLTNVPNHVAATKVGAVVHVLAVTSDNPAKLVRFVDDGGTNPSATTLATAGTNQQFRGVSVSPL